jgi:hypothetical protein
MNTIARPFLLDPGFARLLDSGAFRQRVYESLVAQTGSLLWLVLFFLLPTTITAILGFTLDQKIFIGTAAFGGVALLILGLSVLDQQIGKDKRQRMHRLAFDGELVTGRIVRCERKCYSGPVYKVEVQYTATAPSGKEVTHTQSLERDDLLNQPLPTPGTPVYVLMVDETLFFML